MRDGQEWQVGYEGKSMKAVGGASRGLLAKNRHFEPLTLAGILRALVPQPRWVVPVTHVTNPCDRLRFPPFPRPGKL